MAKKKRQQEEETLSPRVRMHNEPPVFATDYIANLSDDALREHISQLKDTSPVDVENAYAWNSELAWAFRETQHRDLARKLHSKYVQDIRDEENRFNAEEARLTYVNFDNFKNGGDDE